jgi:hypothetical protein
MLQSFFASLVLLSSKLRIPKQEKSSVKIVIISPTPQGERGKGKKRGSSGFLSIHTEHLSW